MDRLTRATALAVVVGLVLSGPSMAADEPPLAPSTTGVATIVAEAGAEVVFRALSLLGVNYRFGGNSPDTGLDCSGLVRLVFQDTLGLPLPRRSEEISRVGGAVETAELQPGDLVFFNTLRRAFSHVGIYIGNNQFVHAPSTGGSIRVENLGSDYWVRRFDGARRLLGAQAPGMPVRNQSGPGATSIASATESPHSSAPASPREPLATTSLQLAAGSTARLTSAAPRPAASRRATSRTQPAAVVVRASVQTAAPRSGPRQRVPDVYVN